MIDDDAAQPKREREKSLAEILVESSVDGLFVLDRDLRYLLWNRAMEEFAGKPASDVVGRRAFDVFPFLRDVGLVDAMDRALAGESVTTDAVPYAAPDQSRRYHDRIYLPLRRDDGVIIGMVGIVRDATARKNAEDALRASDEQVRQAQKLEAVGQLTAGIAHNFNNVLMALLPNLELAARRAPDDLKPLLRRAEDAAQRAADLVRQLMTYAGRNRPTARSVESIDALVDRTVAFCRTTFDRRIHFDARYQHGVRALVDAAQIEQALLNILINARDALGEADVDAPRVTVDVDVVNDGAPELGGRAGDHVRVRISDNGAGMDAATRARIYEPFFTTKDVGRGTGLGLATTQAIAREHGGFLDCTSAPKAGATFSLYLRRDRSDAGAAPTPPPPRSTRGTETILVVDDEAPIREIVSQMLRDAGFRPIVAASGQEALDLAADAHVASEIALVLLDLSMPGLTGRQLRDRLRALTPHARVVYFTGYAFDAADADDAVLEKPITEARLLATVREVLDRSPTSKADAGAATAASPRR